MEKQEIMKHIPLGKTAVTVVDDEDYKYLKQYPWYAAKIGKTKYALRNVLNKKSGERRTKAMHLEILSPPPGQVVDHINRNGLDNRRSNLRLATKAQNGQNREKPKHNKSGYKGVSFRKSHKLWQATIKTANKARHLIYSKDKRICALVYDLAAILHFGPFAKTNFPKV